MSNPRAAHALDERITRKAALLIDNPSSGRPGRSPARASWSRIRATG
ncbi:MAG: type II toxin-antitoxin system RelE/ParE family toxin [Amaricoccus sp.]